MKAIHRNRISKTQRDILREETIKQYESVREEHEQNFLARFTMWFTLVMCMTMDEDFGFGDKRLSKLKRCFREHSIELSDALYNNKCEYYGRYTDFDYDGNRGLLEKLCNQYGIEYKDEWFEI